MLEIDRIPLANQDLCALASLESIMHAFGIHNFTQQDMEKYVHDIHGWGVTPDEIKTIVSKKVDRSHILMKQNWKFEELEVLLKKARVGIIVNITDILHRYDTDWERDLLPDDVDGHYLIIRSVQNIQGRDYVEMVDSSKDQIVQPSKGVITTAEDNVYLVPKSLFQFMWYDVNRDQTTNNHWAIVILHPDDDPRILDKYRRRQLAFEAPTVTSTSFLDVFGRV